MSLVSRHTSTVPPNGLINGTGSRPKLHTLHLELPPRLISAWLVSPQSPMDITALCNLHVVVGREFISARGLVHSGGSFLKHLELRSPHYLG